MWTFLMELWKRLQCKLPVSFRQWRRLQNITVFVMNRPCWIDRWWNDRWRKDQPCTHDGISLISALLLTIIIKISMLQCQWSAMCHATENFSPDNTEKYHQTRNKTPECSQHQKCLNSEYCKTLNFRVPFISSPWQIRENNWLRIFEW